MSAALLNTPNAPIVGWTNPSISYEYMRGIDVKARELNVLVTTNVKREAFLVSWAAWFNRWTAFFTKYQSDWAKLGALFSTDELYQQVLAFRADLESFDRGYAGERDAQGNVLPKSVTPVPQAPGAPGVPAADKGLPWWGWALIVGGVAGLGYVLYKGYQGYQRESAILSARGRALEGGLSKMLPGPFGSAFGAAAHDVTKPALPSERVTLLLGEGG